MPNLWKKVQKQFLDNGIQPEDHINFRQKENKKNGLYWIAQIRFNTLKPFESNESGIKAVKVIQSTDYANMDLFYASAKAIRDDMQEQANAIKKMRQNGGNVNVSHVARAGTAIPHTLDFIMGYSGEGGDYAKDNPFDEVFSDRAYRTLYAYRHQYLNYIRSDFGKTPIEAIDVQQVQKNLRQSGTKLGEMSVKHLKSLWSMLFEVAYYKHWRSDNPAAHVPLATYKIVNQDLAEQRAKGTRRERRTVSDEDFAKIIDIVLDEKKHLKKTGSQQHIPATVASRYMQQVIAHALILMRYSGLRPAECFALMKQDVAVIYDQTKQPGQAKQPTGARLYIRHAVGKVAGNERRLHAPKTKQSRSEVYIGASTAASLLDMIQRSDERVLTHAEPIYDSDGLVKFDPADFIFTNYYGRLPDISKVGNMLNSWLSIHGIEYSMYTNRHQFLSDLARVDGIAAAQQQARHTNVSTTAGYLEEGVERQREVVDSISAGMPAKIKDC